MAKSPQHSYFIFFFTLYVFTRMENHSEVIIRTLVLRIQELETLVKLLQFKIRELESSTFTVEDKTPGPKLD